MLLWAFLCVIDGIGSLRAAWHENDPAWLGRLPLGKATGSVLLAAVGATIVIAAIQPLRYLPQRSALAGSSMLHLPPEQEHDYEFIARSVGANCEVLFTMPGMGSFNFWSGIPAPNGSNLTAWMKGLNAERQQRILNILESVPDACVVYNPTLVKFWGVKEKDLAALPLANYILNQMS